MARTGAQIKAGQLGDKTAFVDGTDYTAALVAVEASISYTVGGVTLVRRCVIDLDDLSADVKAALSAAAEATIFPV